MGHDFQFEKPDWLDRQHFVGGLKLKSKENHDSLVETSWSHTSWISSWGIGPDRVAEPTLHGRYGDGTCP